MALGRWSQHMAIAASGWALPVPRVTNISTGRRGFPISTCPATESFGSFPRPLRVNSAPLSVIDARVALLHRSHGR
jgi:hypothetical protein